MLESKEDVPDNNRPKRYFIYAIGEILLIMIGILLALQVNNWNIGRLQKIEEKEILSNLKTDFKNVIKEFEYLNDLRSQVMSTLSEINRVARTDRNWYNTEQLDSLFSQSLYSPTFNNQIGALEPLFSTGKINLISNDEIKNQLLSWPGEVDDMIEEEKNENELFRKEYLNIIYDHASLANIISNFKLSTINFELIDDVEIINASKVLESDYDPILRNNRFLNILSMRMTLLTINAYETDLLIDKANELINWIDAELEG